MLPSFRLVSVSFLCGFLLVLLGLRLMDSVRIVHQPMPIPPSSAVATAEWRPPARPVVFDLRFSASPGTPLLVPARLPPNTATPPVPGAITPPEPATIAAPTPDDAITPP